MISFRLSPDEYRTLHEACVAQGVTSMSDLARSALRGVIANEFRPGLLSDEVRALKDQLRTISLELERVSRRVEGGG
jgi:hypothetical protein